MSSDIGVDRFFPNYPTQTATLNETESEATLFLTGSVDMQYSKNLQDLLYWIIDRQKRSTRIIVDLAHVSYISSTGVGALTFGMINARKREIEFEVRNIQPKVKAVFEILGIMKFFEQEEKNE